MQPEQPPEPGGPPVGEMTKCPRCGKKVKVQWKSCPFCRIGLK